MPGQRSGAGRDEMRLMCHWTQGLTKLTALQWEGGTSASLKLTPRLSQDRLGPARITVGPA